MYIIDGVAYAGELKPVIKVSGVRPLSGGALPSRRRADRC